MKSDILLIKTGGTIAQKPDEEGILNPSSEDYLGEVRGLDNLANIDVIDVGNIDSTDMQTNISYRGFQRSLFQKDRTDIAKTIFDNASKYDGFVVVHGTDTLVETAAALNYMIQDLGKPIVLTGSQKSMWAFGSDGQRNILTAVQSATQDLGEVVIAFGNYILRGNRSKKINEEGFDAFYTPRLEPLGKLIAVGNGIKLKEHRIKRKKGVAKLFTNFNTGVFNYDHVSGAAIDSALLDVSKNREVQSILIGGFGAGNIPTNLLPFIEKSVENSKPVFVYTKCDVGAADMGIYAVGSASLKAGAISAGDMTPEALGQKLMYSLGKADEKKLVGKDKMNFLEEIVCTPINQDISYRN